MWRYDATPTRVPAVRRGASEPDAARAGRMEMEIAAGQHAPAAARTAVERWLSGRVPARLYDDVRLLVSELVTNSVRHAQLTRDMRIRISARWLTEPCASKSRILAGARLRRSRPIGNTAVGLGSTWWRFSRSAGVPRTTARRVCGRSSRCHRRRDRPMTAWLVVALIAR
jgi:hypothetical protein